MIESENNKNINRGFRKLEVWQEAMDLYLFAKTKIRDLESIPAKIRELVEVSALSCHSHIAERYSWRRGSNESGRLNNAALVALAKNYSLVYALYKGGDIGKEWFDEYDTKHFSVENRLIGFSKEHDSIYKNELLDDWIVG